MERHPGPNISELCRLLGGKWGTVQYHLALLERAGLVFRVPEGRDQRLFPARLSFPETFRIAVLRRRRIQELVRAVIHRPGLRQRELAAAVSMSRKALRGYVDLLTKCGLVQEVRDANFCLYFPTDSLESLLPKISDVLPPPEPREEGEGPGA